MTVEAYRRPRPLRYIPPWTERAACATYPVTRGHDPWYPEYTSGDRAARNGQHKVISQLEAMGRRICLTRCPVVRDCLREALETREAMGIWGGTDPNERKRFAGRYRGEECIDKLIEQATALCRERGIIGPEEGAA